MTMYTQNALLKTSQRRCNKVQLPEDINVLIIILNACNMFGNWVFFYEKIGKPLLCQFQN